MSNWTKKVLSSFLQKHGDFLIEDGVLSEDDFYQVFDFIESVSRLELRTVRCENETNRQPIFIDSFFKDQESLQLRQARIKYVEQLQVDILREVELYKSVQDQMLQYVRISENVFMASIGKYLPEGEKYIRKVF